MKGVKEFIIAFFETSEAVKIRSQIIPIVNVESFVFDMGTIEPYSFTVVNTGSVDMLINGVVVVKGANANSQDTMLDFPRVGTFKRNDQLKITGGSPVQKLEGFIRVDLDLIG